MSAAATARRCSSLPRAIPDAQLVGFDNYAPAIEAANANAAAAGVADRVRFEVVDVTQAYPGHVRPDHHASMSCTTCRSPDRR